ncbi:MAG: M56 family metallopeptidase [Acidobacteria bacterium]|nr:M56 family metallopeptidase [Acidobacteriota bacterium]
MLRIDNAIATFLLNAVWQIGLVAGLTRALVIPLRSSAASLHRLWGFSLVLSLILPLASLMPRDALISMSSVVVQSMSSVVVQENAGSSSPSPAAVSIPASHVAHGELQRDASDLHFPRWLCRTLTTAYGLFLVWRLALSWRAWRATCAIRRTASPILLSEECGRAAERCRVAFGLPSITVVSSPSARVPAALGLRLPIIALPERLLADLSVEDLTVILGHEMAHVRRCDFGMNLVYELLYLPVSFHPAAAFVKRHMASSREQACDEMVVSRLMSSLAYARSLVRIADRISIDEEISYAVGVCEGRNLEERVRRLLMLRSGGRGQSAGWAYVVAGVLSVCSGAGYAAAVRVGPTAAPPPLPAAATALQMKIPAAASDHLPISVLEKRTKPIQAPRNERAVSVGRSEILTNGAGPSDVLGSNTALQENRSRGPEVAPPPPIASASVVLLTDIEPIRESEVGPEHGAKTGTLLAAAQAAAAKLASPQTLGGFVRPRRAPRSVQAGTLLLKTKRRLITWVAVGVASGYALRRIDFEREEHQGKRDKEQHEGR